MNRIDWLFLLVFGTTTLTLLFPWQLDLGDAEFNFFYRLALALGVLVPSGYGLWSIKHRKQVVPKVLLCVGLIVGGFLGLQALTGRHSTKGVYAEFYTNPENEFERISVIHRHFSGLHNHNQTLHLISFPHGRDHLKKNLPARASQWNLVGAGRQSLL